LLCAHCDRPRRRAPESQDELPPLHFDPPAADEMSRDYQFSALTASFKSWHGIDAASSTAAARYRYGFLNDKDAGVGERAESAAAPNSCW